MVSKYGGVLRPVNRCGYKIIRAIHGLMHGLFVSFLEFRLQMLRMSVFCPQSKKQNKKQKKAYMNMQLISTHKGVN